MIKRDIEDNITTAAKFFPVVTILGLRRSGKTTIAKKLFSSHEYVSLEDIDIRAQAIEDPRKFLTINCNGHGLIIDEVQHVPIKKFLKYKSYTLAKINYFKYI